MLSTVRSFNDALGLNATAPIDQCQQSASNRTARRIAWLVHAFRVSGVYLRPHGEELGRGVGPETEAKSSHGRSHRFDPCHAHQPKRLPASIVRAACQKICQKTGACAWSHPVRVTPSEPPASHKPLSR
jgi:hypothetical protein